MPEKTVSEHTLAELHGVHDLLSHLRRDHELVARFHQNPDDVIRQFDLAPDFADLVRTLDVRGLYDRGVNPYLLFFGALELGVERSDYYARMMAQ